MVIMFHCHQIEIDLFLLKQSLVNKSLHLRVLMVQKWSFFLCYKEDVVDYWEYILISLRLWFGFDLKSLQNYLQRRQLGWPYPFIVYVLLDYSHHFMFGFSVHKNGVCVFYLSVYFLSVLYELPMAFNWVGIHFQQSCKNVVWSILYLVQLSL